MCKAETASTLFVHSVGASRQGARLLVAAPRPAYVGLELGPFFLPKPTTARAQQPREAAAAQTLGRRARKACATYAPRSRQLSSLTQCPGVRQVRSATARQASWQPQARPQSAQRQHISGMRACCDEAAVVLDPLHRPALGLLLLVLLGDLRRLPAHLARARQGPVHLACARRRSDDLLRCCLATTPDQAQPVRTALNEKELGYSTAWQGTHPWLRLSAPKTIAGLPGRLRLSRSRGLR